MIQISNCLLISRAHGSQSNKFFVDQHNTTKLSHSFMKVYCFNVDFTFAMDWTFSSRRKLRCPADWQLPAVGIWCWNQNTILRVHGVCRKRSPIVDFLKCPMHRLSDPGQWFCVERAGAVPGRLQFDVSDHEFRCPGAWDIGWPHWTDMIYRKSIRLCIFRMPRKNLKEPVETQLYRIVRRIFQKDSTGEATAASQKTSVFSNLWVRRKLRGYILFR
jgi:hypothetical protein